MTSPVSSTKALTLQPPKEVTKHTASYYLDALNLLVSTPEKRISKAEAAKSTMEFSSSVTCNWCFDDIEVRIPYGELDTFIVTDNHYAAPQTKTNNRDKCKSTSEYSIDEWQAFIKTQINITPKSDKEEEKAKVKAKKTTAENFFLTLINDTTPKQIPILLDIIASPCLYKLELEFSQKIADSITIKIQQLIKKLAVSDWETLSTLYLLIKNSVSDHYKPWIHIIDKPVYEKLRELNPSQTLKILTENNSRIRDFWLIRQGITPYHCGSPTLHAGHNACVLTYLQETLEKHNKESNYTIQCPEHAQTDEHKSIAGNIKHVIITNYLVNTLLLQPVEETNVVIKVRHLQIDLKYIKTPKTQNKDELHIIRIEKNKNEFTYHFMLFQQEGYSCVILSKSPAFHKNKTQLDNAATKRAAHLSENTLILFKTVTETGLKSLDIYLKHDNKQPINLGTITFPEGSSTEFLKKIIDPCNQNTPIWKSSEIAQQILTLLKYPKQVETLKPEEALPLKIKEAHSIKAKAVLLSAKGLQNELREKLSTLVEKTPNDGIIDETQVQTLNDLINASYWERNTSKLEALLYKHALPEFVRQYILNELKKLKENKPVTNTNQVQPKPIQIIASLRYLANYQLSSEHTQISTNESEKIQNLIKTADKQDVVYLARISRNFHLPEHLRNLANKQLETLCKDFTSFETNTITGLLKELNCLQSDLKAQSSYFQQQRSSLKHHTLQILHQNLIQHTTEQTVNTLEQLNHSDKQSNPFERNQQLNKILPFVLTKELLPKQNSQKTEELFFEYFSHLELHEKIQVHSVLKNIFLSLGTDCNELIVTTTAQIIQQSIDLNDPEVPKEQHPALKSYLTENSLKSITILSNIIHYIYKNISTVRDEPKLLIQNDFCKQALIVSQEESLSYKEVSYFCNICLNTALVISSKDQIEEVLIPLVTRTIDKLMKEDLKITKSVDNIKNFIDKLKGPDSLVLTYAIAQMIKNYEGLKERLKQDRNSIINILIPIMGIFREFVKNSEKITCGALLYILHTKEIAIMQEIQKEITSRLNKKNPNRPKFDPEKYKSYPSNFTINAIFQILKTPGLEENNILYYTKHLSGYFYHIYKQTNGNIMDLLLLGITDFVFDSNCPYSARVKLASVITTIVSFYTEEKYSFTSETLEVVFNGLISIILKINDGISQDKPQAQYLKDEIIKSFSGIIKKIRDGGTELTYFPHGDIAQAKLASLPVQDKRYIIRALTQRS